MEGTSPGDNICILRALFDRLFKAEWEHRGDEVQSSLLFAALNCWVIMVCDEELSSHCQKDPEHHLKSHWFIKWCLQTIGANEQAVKDRQLAPWVVLLWVGPIHWLRVAALVCHHSFP
jgi:hypothetical protein